MGLIFVTLSALIFGWNTFAPDFLVYLILTLILLTLYLFEKTVYQFHEDRIQRSIKTTLVEARDMTGITISSDELTLHTTKFINHHTFKAKRLSKKNWIEFQRATEEFAARHEHIKVEKI